MKVASTTLALLLLAAFGFTLVNAQEDPGMEGDGESESESAGNEVEAVMWLYEEHRSAVHPENESHWKQDTAWVYALIKFPADFGTPFSYGNFELVEAKTNDDRDLTDFDFWGSDDFEQFNQGHMAENLPSDVSLLSFQFALPRRSSLTARATATMDVRFASDEVTKTIENVSGKKSEDDVVELFNDEEVGIRVVLQPGSEDNSVTFHVIGNYEKIASFEMMNEDGEEFGSVSRSSYESWNEDNTFVYEFTFYRYNEDDPDPSTADLQIKYFKSLEEHSFTMKLKPFRLP